MAQTIKTRRLELRPVNSLDARSCYGFAAIGGVDTHREEVSPLSTGAAVTLQKMMLTRATWEARA